MSTAEYPETGFGFICEDLIAESASGLLLVRADSPIETWCIRWVLVDGRAKVSGY